MFHLPTITNFLCDTTEYLSQCEMWTWRFLFYCFTHTHTHMHHDNPREPVQEETFTHSHLQINIFSYPNSGLCPCVDMGTAVSDCRHVDTVCILPTVIH